MGKSKEGKKKRNQQSSSNRHPGSKSNELSKKSVTSQRQPNVAKKIISKTSLDLRIDSIKVATETPTASTRGLSALQQKFAKKLEGARFRTINEKLYTTNGSDAFKDFQSDPALFEVYHMGFREQAAGWPENPLDGIIAWILHKHKGAMIADMGCGDARLAQSVPNKVHSFDLVSTNKRVVAADVANVPLENNSVDIVVFCLSLMGTNIADFILEAHRILKLKGILKIVEVRSRFEGESEGIKKFIRTLKRAGFDMSSSTNNAPNKMFFMMECTKSDRTVESQKMEFSAKPCLYKRR